VYTPRHDSSLSNEPVEQIDKLVRVWTERYITLGALGSVDYVYVFENKGPEVGVTLHHPHGQIYAYPFVPPLIARELECSSLHQKRRGTCLGCDIVAEERRDGRRLVAENAGFAAYVPAFARWPYEVHLSARRHIGALTELSRQERRDLASLLKSVLVAYDRLFDRPFPYVMALHQRPTDGRRHDHYHFHIEIYPPLRTAHKLKYLAGSEIGAGTFINDTLPEQKAAELRTHLTPAVWDDEGFQRD
jgi:UDPglucose--hexose-1-phosphate uridylyltransferase